MNRYTSLVQYDGQVAYQNHTDFYGTEAKNGSTWKKKKKKNNVWTDEHYCWLQ